LVSGVFLWFFSKISTYVRSETYCKQLLEYLDSIKYGKLATIVGRYYARDRDKRWERVQVAYEMLTQGKGEKSSDALKTIQERYAKDETDEFLKPIVLDEAGVIKDGDVLIFFNYRSDRMREINQAFGIPPMPFETAVQPKVVGSWRIALFWPKSS
jgi:2,3-bisphosphoglycerate-independent phosphoglycerate mutase